MKKLVNAAIAAEVISEKYSISLGELVDVFAQIPTANGDDEEPKCKSECLLFRATMPSEYEIALFHFVRDRLYIKNGFQLVMSDEEIDARTLDAMEKLRAKADSPRLRGQYLSAVKVRDNSCE